VTYCFWADSVDPGKLRFRWALQDCWAGTTTCTRVPLQELMACPGDHQLRQWRAGTVMFSGADLFRFLRWPNNRDKQIPRKVITSCFVNHFCKLEIRFLM
jgi:hypothetical protein